ncbi:MAG: replication protein RepA [Acidobacteria bacterium]|nr:replication protein RepA [Acidobacteriota bacterium]
MRPLSDVLLTEDRRRLSRRLQRLPAPRQGGLERHDHVEVAFMARLLTLCALPRRDRGDERQYMRRNGPYTMIVTATGRSGLPFGTLPRLLLAWICTEVVRTQAARLRLGATLAEFMRELGITSRSGGVRGDRTRLRDQIERLFNASIRLSYEGEGVTRSVASMIADRSELWWKVESHDTPSRWVSTVRLGSGFFAEILRRPVPVDMATLRALRRCALGLDLYLWLTYATFRLDRPRRITWPALYRQFADQPSELYDKNEVQMFRRRALRELRKIKRTWPALNYSVEAGQRGHKSRAGALVLGPTAPKIPARRSRVAR